jgi:spermidine synthase
MSRAADFLSGIKVLEEIESPINGKIQVVKSLAFGTYIQVEGLTQSGGVMYGVWKTTLKKLSHQSLIINHCLILGLGGGDAARLVRKYWPEAKITGIELDPIMVEMGKKYLKLDEVGADVAIEDAEKFLLTISHQPSSINYDLILVDLYVGYGVPKKFDTKEFAQLVKKLLTPEGLSVFNRLYSGEKRKEAEVFHRKLIQAFSKVRPIYPEANVMFVCKI